MRVRQMEIVHNNPVWREKANFIVGASLPEDDRTEQLWARQLGERHFQVCCVPFFVYDVALGDVVETDANYDVERVVERSGRFVFRVWFGESFHPRQEIADELERLGALLEWSSTNLIAVDARDENAAQLIANYLDQQERVGRLTFETGAS